MLITYGNLPEISTPYFPQYSLSSSSPSLFLPHFTPPFQVSWGGLP